MLLYKIKFADVLSLSEKINGPSKPSWEDDTLLNIAESIAFLSETFYKEVREYQGLGSADIRSLFIEIALEFEKKYVDQNSWAELDWETTLYNFGKQSLTEYKNKGK